MPEIFNSEVWGGELTEMSMMDHSHGLCVSHDETFLRS